jgi:tripartite-type tricarboxylate transporter receptor subunit TctC
MLSSRVTRLIGQFLGVAVVLALPCVAAAQTYPDHPVRMIVPFAAAGGVDVMARALANDLQIKWKQPVLVENLTGGGATIGANTVAKAKPDGYTLLFTTDQSVTATYFVKDIGYDPLKDLAPITLITDVPQIVIAHPSLPANDLKGLVAYAKQNPAKLNYGSYGNGSAIHLFFEGLKKEAGIDIAHVPYRGASAVFAALVGNEVQLALAGTQSTPPLLQAGKIKLLAIDRAERHPNFLDVPTLTEEGFPDIGPRPWYGLFTTAGTPQPLIQQIQKDVSEVLNSDAFNQKNLKPYGYVPTSMTPEEFSRFVKSDFEQKGRLAKIAGAKPE